MSTLMVLLSANGVFGVVGSGLSEEQEGVAALILDEFSPSEHETALAVAWCESRLGLLKQYPLKQVFDPNRKGAAGVFQMIPSTWEWHTGLPWHLAGDAELNVRYAVTLQESHGWSQWHCWNLGCRKLGRCHMGEDVKEQLLAMLGRWVSPHDRAVEQLKVRPMVLVCTDSSPAQVRELTDSVHNGQAAPGYTPVGPDRFVFSEPTSESRVPSDVVSAPSGWWIVWV